MASSKPNPPARKPKVKKAAPATPQETAAPEGWNAHFKRGWTDFEDGVDNTEDYRGNPAKLKDKDAYLSGRTGAKNYAKVKAGSPAGGNLA